MSRLWRVRGLGKTGKPVELRLRAIDHEAARMIAARRCSSVSSIVLVDEPHIQGRGVR